MIVSQFALQKDLSGTSEEESCFPSFSKTIKKANRFCIDSLFLGQKLNYNHHIVVSAFLSL